MGEPLAHAAVRVAGAQSEIGGDYEEHRHDRERHERQAPVDPEHDGDDARERDHVGDHGEEPAREGFAHRLGVVEDPCHEPADRIAIEEGGLEPEEPAEALRAKVVNHELAGELHQVGLEPAERVEERQHARVEARDPGEAEPVGPEDVLVDGDLEEVRLGELRRGDQREEERRTGDERPVGPRRLPEPRDQPAVEGAP